MQRCNPEAPPPKHNPVPRTALSVDEFAESTGLSRTTAYQLMRDGQLGFVKVGTRRLIPVAEMESFLARLRESA